jgi:hypothetical protein
MLRKIRRNIGDDRPLFEMAEEIQYGRTTQLIMAYVLPPSTNPMDVIGKFSQIIICVFNIICEHFVKYRY